MENLYYLDNAATTKVFDEVYQILRESNENFYNPSASYMHAMSSRNLLETARSKITQCLHGNAGRVIFTSSATESNNMVAEGVHLRAGDEVLISGAEHPSVYNAFKRLEKQGIMVKIVPLSRDGRVDFEGFKQMLNDKVKLVSIIHVSNETGAVNDIKELCMAAKKFNSKIVFHSDGVQAVGKIRVNLNNLGVDLYTFSSHKLHSPRGIAGLWVKSGVNIDALLEGGGQEFGLRSSTENVSGAIALSYCIEKVTNELDDNFQKVLGIKNALVEKLKASELSNLEINSNEDCSPYILSVSFAGIKGEVLMNALESDGVIVSTGSACSSKKAGNRVLEAMGLSPAQVVGSIRISFSAYDEYDINYIAGAIANNVQRFLKTAKNKR